MLNSFLLRYSPPPSSLMMTLTRAGLATRANPSHKKEFSLVRKQEDKEIKNVLENVNKSALDEHGSRLFAVVQLAGSQFKVTTEDVIMVRGNFYPTIGDRIRLEKVLLAGSKDFSVVGKPLLSKDFIRIEATVIEKTLSNDVIIFTYKPRKDNRKMNFQKSILTLLRINSIDVLGPVPGFESNKS